MVDQSPQDDSGGREKNGAPGGATRALPEDARQAGTRWGFTLIPSSTMRDGRRGIGRLSNSSLAGSIQEGSHGSVWEGFDIPLSSRGIARERFPRARVFLGELFPGRDGKFRYLKEIRIEMYRKMVEWLREGRSGSFYLPLHGKPGGLGKGFWLGPNEQRPSESPLRTTAPEIYK